MSGNDQAAIDALVARITPEDRPASNGKGINQPADIPPPNVSDAIKALQRDPTRQALFDGGNGKYYTASEADAAFFHHAAFYGRRDLQVMEEIALSSGRNRKKWHERRGGTTWLRQELAKAAERTSDVWNPPTERVKITVGGKHRVEQSGEDGNNAGEGFIRSSRGKDNSPTHDELRDRFIQRNPEYRHGLGAWRKFTNEGYYREVADAAVRREVAAVCEDAKEEGVRPTHSVVKSVTGMTEDARHVPDELWDADSDSLVFRNGILHVPTRTLRPHDPGHFVTAALPYDYDPDAQCPQFENFLAGRIGKMVWFVQEFAGYCLTRDTTQEIALWLYGPPGSGRSTFIMAIEATLGPLVGPLSIGDLERDQFALTALVGKTLVTATEFPSRKLQGTDSVLNGIISGDQIRVNEKNKPRYNIYPGAKVLWAMNDLPRVPDPNNGLFRRVRVVPFPELAPEKRDPALKTAIRAEAPGILNWALEGLARLQERGHFAEPEEVKTATLNFKETNDVPAMFIDEECEYDPNGEVSGKTLYSKYKEWTLENGYYTLPHNRVGAEWRRLGITEHRTKGGKRWRGIVFRQEIL